MISESTAMKAMSIENLPTMIRALEFFRLEVIELEVHPFDVGLQRQQVLLPVGISQRQLFRNIEESVVFDGESIPVVELVAFG